MAELIHVNFGKPMPVFPLPETVLLPHAVQPLHIFEPRYLQMVNHCLDSSGQFAMATFQGRIDEETYRWGLPPLRPAVCVGQIVRHESYPDGRQQITLHGVCRAKILDLVEPDEEREYRMAHLIPLEAVEEEP
ncbi:MAG: LON peptidase substrate-binding domain-containing protein, partial [Phycisphaerales bacterium]